MPTFATPEPVSVTIDLLSGDIRVIASERTDTVVDVRPRDESSDRDVRVAAQTKVEFAEGRLTVKSPKPLQVLFGWWTGTVDVTVQVPVGSQLHGTTADGDVRCEGRLGDCSLRTYDGDISVHEAQTVRLTTTDGRITVDRVEGDAHITGSGDVQVIEVGGGAYVKNLHGPSWLGQVRGDVRVHAAHGDITIESAGVSEGAPQRSEERIERAAGRRDGAGPQVVARTAHGSVRLAEVARGSASLQTASGDVEIGIRRGSAAWLDVKSSSGHVRNELEPTGDPQGVDDSVQVRARTWDGDIVIRRAA